MKTYAYTHALLAGRIWKGEIEIYLTVCLSNELTCRFERINLLTRVIVPFSRDSVAAVVATAAVRYSFLLRLFYFGCAAKCSLFHARVPEAHFKCYSTLFECELFELNLSLFFVCLRFEYVISGIFFSPFSTFFRYVAWWLLWLSFFFGNIDSHPLCTKR